MKKHFLSIILVSIFLLCIIPVGLTTFADDGTEPQELEEPEVPSEPADETGADETDEAAETDIDAQDKPPVPLTVPPVVVGNTGTGANRDSPQPTPRRPLPLAHSYLRRPFRRSGGNRRHFAKRDLQRDMRRD